MPRRFKAILAMARNRVIGAGNKLPWHIPEELRWFKKMTTGNVIIMGRKTWESIGKPLPNRETIVVSRGSIEIPGVRVVKSLTEIEPGADARDYFVIGGAQLFEAALPHCSDVYLTLVKREAEGDVYLPPFEHEYSEPEMIQDNEVFSILHYRRKAESQLNDHC